jgi:hypothetical protein
VWEFEDRMVVTDRFFLHRVRRGHREEVMQRRGVD